MTAADRRLLESFGKALAAQKLNLVYQPKVSLKDGRLTRVERMIRRGPGGAHVKNVNVDDEEPAGSYKEFSIK